MSVRSKASERRFSHSKASSDNAACGRHALALLFNIEETGVSRMRQLGVAAFANGMTIRLQAAP